LFTWYIHGWSDLVNGNGEPQLIMGQRVYLFAAFIPYHPMLVWSSNVSNNVTTARQMVLLLIVNATGVNVFAGLN
jgi:hypothetical protein